MDIEKIRKKFISGLPPALLSIILFFTNKYMFGMSNAIISTYMTLTFVNMRKNIFIESNGMKNYLVHITLGIFASLATQSLIGTLIINFVVTTVASYVLTKEYDSARYFTFMLGFVLMQLIPVKIELVYLRIFAITYSYLMIRLFLRIFSKNGLRKDIYRLINKEFSLLREELEYAYEGNSSKYLEVEEEFSSTLGELNRIIYESYEKDYFQLVVAFGQLNNFNKRILKRRDLASKNKDLIDNLKVLLDQSEGIESGEDLINYSNKIKAFLYKYKDKSTFNNCLEFTFKYIISAGVKIGVSESKKKAKFFNIRKKDEEVDILDCGVRFDAYRVRFALRLGILLTLGFGIDKWLEFPKVYWLPLSIYVMAVPYYEDSRKRIKQRIGGTIGGLVLAFILFYLFRTELDHIMIIILATTVMFSIDNYAAKNIYTTCYAMAITSFSMNPDEAILFRLIYTLLGGIIVFIGNKYILPNKSEHEINKTLCKMIQIDKSIIKNTILIGEYSDDLLFYYVKASYLIDNKLNKLIGEKDKAIKEVMTLNNEWINNMVYSYILIDKNKLSKADLESIKEYLRVMERNLSEYKLQDRELNVDNLDISEFLNESYNKEQKIIKLVDSISKNKECLKI